MTGDGAGEITRLLRAAGEGGEAEADAALDLVYQDLKRIARGQLARWRPGETLNTTALVHEGYARLADSNPMYWNNRRHYFAVAARAMRLVVVDYARRLFADKRRGVHVEIDLANLPDDGPGRAEQAAVVDQLLERLDALDPEMVRIVECRFYAGYTLTETADVLNISQRTVQRKWERARAWLVALNTDS
ncbi:MAG: ECF-type sigma factor [Wenzhouxiangellaceae bacterium]